MDGVILFSGKGTRMGSSFPKNKCMIDIDGKPLVGHILSHFERAGIDKAYIVVGHMKEQVVDYLRNFAGGINIDFIEDNADTPSTSRPLMLVKDMIGQDFIYSHSEINYKGSLIENLCKSKRRGSDGTVAISSRLNIAQTHPIVTVKGGFVSDMDYGMPEGNSEKYCYMGVCRFDKSIFEYLPSDRLVFRAIKNMIKNGRRIGYLLYTDEWKHFTTPEDTTAVNMEFKR